MRLEPIIRIPALTSAVWRRFAVHLFEGHVTVDDMVRLEASGDAWRAQHPGRLVELVVIHPSGSRMTTDERMRMARIIKKGEAHRTASATVIVAGGILGAAQRSVLTGLSMIVPPIHPFKVFGVVSDAVAWLTPHVAELCGPEATHHALLDAVETFRDEFRRERV